MNMAAQKTPINFEEEGSWLRSLQNDLPVLGLVCAVFILQLNCEPNLIFVWNFIKIWKKVPIQPRRVENNSGKVRNKTITKS